MELLEGQLPDEALLRTHRHTSECDACRRLLASVTRGGLGGARVRSLPGAQAPEDTGGEACAWTPPEAFDEFRLERLIGQGGMGIVYLAHDTSLDRHVAVKFIASSQPAPWVRTYFSTEARVIARLQHPNVVTVFRVGEVSGHPYIVSEYIAGQSLAELPLPVPWRRVLTLGVGLARGLAAAHRQGVLHRDLKPSNALVTAEGEVKLLDFGLAERFSPAERPASSRAMQVVGTPSYMAPELLEQAPATPRSDIYALGLILQELCSGEVPRRAPGRTRENSAPAVLPPGMDPDFAAIIARCLAPHPQERFASAERLCEALERLERLIAPAPLVEGNPYRGLAPFEAEHREFFFGRDADIRALLERLGHRPMVLVAGDSGAGKSSLCRAGLLPRILANARAEGREQATVTLWPGRAPIKAMASALAPSLGRKEEELVTALMDAPEEVGRMLREAHSNGRGLLLFIDQLEELITLSDPLQAAHFSRFLEELALPSSGTRVLLAVRGDFLTRLCALPGLGSEAERALYILRPMSPENVREAIVGPARSRGVVFESEELVQTLVAATVNSAGSLPLLQFALAELWERRDPAQGCLTRASLEEMGGVAGALSRHADGVLKSLSAAEREAVRLLLLHLVTPDGTRIERSEQELVADESSRTALRALVAGRLLHTRTVGGQPCCEIAHDSLIGSWGTLRGWLHDDIGHRAVRKRLEEASAEWERLLHARETLWGQRQLDEARLLEPNRLGPREQAFLLASGRAVTRQRWGRWLGVLVLVFAVSASYAGLRLQEYLVDTRFIATQVGLAREALAAGRALAQQARERREAALSLFDGRPLPSLGLGAAPGPHGMLEAAERQWAQALSLRERANAAYSLASRELERALDRDRDQESTRRLIPKVLHDQAVLAELFHQRREYEEWVRRLEQSVETSKEGAEWLQSLRAPAELDLVTDPPGARVELKRYTDGRGVNALQVAPESRTLGLTPLTRAVLPAGSYLLTLTKPGYVPVTLPLLLTHGAHERVPVSLPTAVPEGSVYIPPGCFLQGSAEPEVVRGFMYSAPLHRLCLKEGYLIGRREVTFGDWLAYLDSLPPEAPARRFLEEPRFGDGGAVSLRHRPGVGWIFSFYHSREDVVTAKEGEKFRYPERTWRATADWRQFPLSGVSALDLEGYFYWLDRTGRFPGARLCGQNEWEYAARGADGRLYPHGDQLQLDDANIDTTYGRQPTAFGPDMVGSHPASVSPFGLEDMAGNAYELTRSETREFGRVIHRGGAWYYDAFTAYSANISPGNPTARDARIGVRVCASFSPHPSEALP